MLIIFPGQYWPDPPCGRLHLSNIFGEASEAKPWYMKFNLLTNKYEWDDAENACN